MQDESHDSVYQHGLGIAAAIRRETAAQGRKRRPDSDAKAEADAGHSQDGSQEEPNNETGGKKRDTPQQQRVRGSPSSTSPDGPKAVQLVTSPEGSTNSSSLSRRRSARSWLLPAVTGTAGAATASVPHSALSPNSFSQTAQSLSSLLNLCDYCG